MFAKMPNFVGQAGLYYPFKEKIKSTTVQLIQNKIMKDSFIKVI